MSEFQITVHQLTNGSPQAIGFGVTAEDGSFTLYKSGATAGLWIEPGEYCFTLESVGAPTPIPKDYTKPDTTPWKIQWTTDMSLLELQLPETPAPTR